ncbi:MAG: hypothetical protein RMN25_03215 [Anaerolineae bacterium]|nr:ATP-grasp domain-containing protein [Thermoflexales bacterium]MDW8406768.1 hypothetical protein [Anaerolineae bacterium]
MRILWLGWEDQHTPARVQAVAVSLGLHVTLAQITDLRFVVDGATGMASVGVWLDEEEVTRAFDVLIARVFHPYISEALTVARLFHDAGKVVIDHSLTDEGVAFSKMHDYLLLAQAGLSVPRTWQLGRLEAVEALAEELGYPLVFKGIHGSYGAHVHLVRTAEDLRAVWARYRPGELMLQEYLPAAVDFRVMCVGYQALPMVVERAPKAGDFRTNAQLGGSAVARPLADFPDLGRLAEQAARVLRREFAAVDVRYRGAAPLVLEVNRRPVFANFERVTGCDVARAFLNYVCHRYEASAPSLAALSSALLAPTAGGGGSS